MIEGLKGSESLVLWGLVQNPTYTGRQLASTLGLSESTVSRAKRKLRDTSRL